MSSKDDPGRDKARPGDAGQPKKPYATIDLKAVEVPAADPKAAAEKPAETKPQDAKSDKPAAPAWSGTGPKPAEMAAAAASGAATVGAKAEPAKPDAAKTETKTDAAKSAAAPVKTATPQAKPNDVKPAAKPAAETPPPPTVVKRGGGFFSHLTAGVVGGFLALLGGDQLIQTLGIPNDALPFQTGTSALQQRIAALEAKGAGGAAGGDVAARLTDADARLARLEEQARGLGNLSAASGQMAEETRALQEKVAQLSSGDVVTRIAKLEDTLASLAAAGQSEGAGRLPQLAALNARIKELEGAIAGRTDAVRRDLTQALETRAQQASEVGEVARNATQRIDRDLSSMRTETATLTQRVEALKADNDRANQTLRVLQEETGGIRSAVEAMKGDLDSRLKTVARPNDVSAAVSPVTAKLAELEQALQGVVKSEADRRSNAERIVLSLELANLKRVLDRGQRYETELGEVRKAAGGKIELGPLDKFKSQGVPTVVDLVRDFRPVAKAILDAEAEPADGTVVERLLAGAKSIVRVRKVEPSASDKSAEAVVARMEKSLQDGQLGRVQEEAKTLPARAQDVAKDWLEKVEARYSVDRALASVEGQLKSSLGGGRAQN